MQYMSRCMQIFMNLQKIKKTYNLKWSEVSTKSSYSTMILRSHGKCTCVRIGFLRRDIQPGEKNRPVWLAIYSGESDQLVNWPRHGLLGFLMAVSPPGERQRGWRRCKQARRRRGRGVRGAGRDPAAPGLPPDALPRRLQGRRPPAPRQTAIPPISSRFHCPTR